MAETSIIKNFTIAGLTGGFIISMILVAIVMMDTNYDISGYENSSFSTFGNLSEYSDLVNESSSEVYTIQKDDSLFDVLGGLVVAAVGAVTTFLTSFNFLQTDLVNMINSMGLGAGAAILGKYIVAILVAIFAIYLMIKVFSKADDKL